MRVGVGTALCELASKVILRSASAYLTSATAISGCDATQASDADSRCHGYAGVLACPQHGVWLGGRWRCALVLMLQPWTADQQTPELGVVHVVWSSNADLGRLSLRVGGPSELWLQVAASGCRWHIHGLRDASSASLVLCACKNNLAMVPLLTATGPPVPAVYAYCLALLSSCCTW